VNKSQLVDHVADQLHISKAGAARLVDSVLDGIKDGLREDKRVTISGFGTFEVKPRKARTGINPHTREPIEIAAGHRVGFRVGKSLKQLV
jgi:DNA-binding protein HU-beta